MANHAVLGFLPQFFGFGPEGPRHDLHGSPLYLLINGASAVSFFFVLSGYVLTRKYCQTGDLAGLVKGAAKRWPRLAGPVLVTVLTSYTLFYFHLYDFEDAGAASGSKWLAKFGNSFSGDISRASIHLRGALEEGSWGTFFRGECLFDSSLWTMQPEIIGSFLAFGAAPILLEAKKSSTALMVALVFLIVTLLYLPLPQVAAFPVGVSLAILLPRHGSAKLSPAIAYPALLVAFYLLGFSAKAVGIYAGFQFLVTHEIPYSYPQIVGAAILICVIETFPPIRNPLSTRFSAFLGELSFPVYLLHLLVICSVGSEVYLAAGALPAIGSVFVVSVLASLPLIAFNAWWVDRVNQIANLALGKGIPEPHPQS